MNTKRIVFWAVFISILVLIIWGMVVALNKPTAGSVSGLLAPSPVTASDNVRGPADAPVTLIEYSDFQCPACKAYYPIIEKLVASSTNLRLVYRHFPLYPMPHPNALIAAQAAQTAGLQGKFWDMYRVLFEKQSEWENLSKTDVRARFETYATTIGLDISKYRADLDSTQVTDKISADKKDGMAIGINGTPTFFVNGKAISNPQSYDAFKAIIDQAAR